MQKARRHGSRRSDRLWAHGFRVSFTPLAGSFSPFPHGTRSLSVSQECLALPDGPGRFAQDYSCPALLRMPRGLRTLRVRGSHPLRPGFPARSPRALGADKCGPTTPAEPKMTTPVWALPRSLATTGGITKLFSLPPGTKMFQFPGFASARLARG